MHRALAVTVVASVVLVASVSRADGTEDEKLYSCDKRVSRVSVTFKPDVTLGDLVVWAMGFSCKTFVYDPKIVATSRKVVIIAPTEMSTSEAYDLFLGALARMGLAIVKSGDKLHIVEAPTVKHESLPLVDAPGGADEVVRVVLHPAYAKAEMLRTAFESMRSEAGDLQQLGSLLLVTDYGSHVRDMIALAKLIDVPNGSDAIYTIAVVHADAVKLATKLETLLGVGPSSVGGASGSSQPSNAQNTPGIAKSTDVNTTSPSKILVDERTNTLVIAASQPAYERVKALVQRLDVPIDIEGGTSIHVYQLTNAVAEEVAKTVNDAINRSTPTSTAAHPPGTVAPPTSVPGVADPLAVTGSARIIADAKSNKVIVSASGRDYLAIKNVIDQLDEPRRQVFIDTVILTIDVSDERDMGASGHGVTPAGSSGIAVGAVQTGTLTTTTDTGIAGSLASATGLVAGLIGSDISSTSSFAGLGTSIASYALLFQAVAIASKTSTIAEPSIVAVDNETAKLSVGQNVPYIKGTIPLSAVNPTGITTTNIDRADLNFDLEIKPHISANDNVLLEIKNEAKALGTTDKTLGPSWNTRSFETRVVVHDRASVVLSGIMQTSDVDATTKVPVLGDIPLVGYLFKYTTRTKRRSNVLILLTPYIVKDALDLQQITARKQREHDEFIESYDTLAHMHYKPEVDYRRKRGLVEDINLAVEAVDNDAAARAALHAPARVVDGAIQ